MAKTFDYIFNGMSRIGMDSCDQSQQTLQNNEAANYQFSNNITKCPMTETIDIATSQPSINYTGGYDGCEVDKNSELTHTKITRDKDRISLEQRQFLTVPYLGRGKINTNTETELQRGQMFFDKKSDNATSEISHISYRHTPMIPSLEEEMNNPVNCIESVAADGWIRGGLPSRDLLRDNN